MMVQNNSFQLAIFNPEAHQKKRAAEGWKEPQIKAELKEIVEVIKTFKCAILTGDTLEEEFKPFFASNNSGCLNKSYNYLRVKRERRPEGDRDHFLPLDPEDLMGFKHFIWDDTSQKATCIALAIISPNRDTTVTELKRTLEYLPFVDVQDEEQFVDYCDKAFRAEETDLQIVLGVRFDNASMTIHYSERDWAVLQSITITGGTNTVFDEEYYDTESKSFKKSLREIGQSRITIPAIPAIEYFSDDDDDSETETRYGSCSIV